MRRPKQPKEGFSLTINGDTDTATGQLLIYLFSREDNFKGTEEPDSVAIEYPTSKSTGFSFHTTFYANPDGESYRVGGSGVTVKASTDVERQMIKSVVVRQEAALKKHLAALALQAKETEAELALVRDCWEDRLKNLSADELREKCIHLQAEVWKGKRDQVILRHALIHVAELGDEKIDQGDTVIEHLKRANAAYYWETFQDATKAYAADHLYRQRHIKMVLDTCGLVRSKSTIKRDLIEAHQRGVIPAIEDQGDGNSKQNCLNLEELGRLVMFIASEKMSRF
jgi:hypothetical protein